MTMLREVQIFTKDYEEWDSVDVLGHRGGKRFLEKGQLT